MPRQAYLVLTVKVHLLLHEQGGRRSGITRGYRSGWLFPDGFTHDAPMRALVPDSGDDWLLPGEYGEAEVVPIAPEYWDKAIKVGDEISMVEGARVVGTAMVIGIDHRDLDSRL